MSKDVLGVRMKENYEFRARQFLPRRTHTLIRLDGKSFHTYTRDLDRPFDIQFMNDMAETARHLCKEIQGAVMAYAQSDEISLVLQDYATIKTDAWFDGNVQKMVSVAASAATAKFNELRPGKLAMFDARCFVIPDLIEVANYFIWRQKDATRNSISMVAQSEFSQKELHGKSSNEMQEMLWAEHCINWNDYEPRLKRGTVVVKSFLQEVYGPVLVRAPRSTWEIEAAPIFKAEQLADFLKSEIQR